MGLKCTLLIFRIKKSEPKVLSVRQSFEGMTRIPQIYGSTKDISRIQRRTGFTMCPFYSPNIFFQFIAFYKTHCHTQCRLAFGGKKIFAGGLKNMHSGRADLASSLGPST